MKNISTLGERQQNLLQMLLSHRDGLTVEQLKNLLNISRNAVNQHLSSLGANGFVTNMSQESTGGRPSKAYILSSEGLELFPRHYSFFSNKLVAWLKSSLTSQQVIDCMQDIGKEIATDLQPRLDSKNTPQEKAEEAILIMQELGYQASITSNNGVTEIIANNCVFHQIADTNNEVCQLDISLISHLLNTKVSHEECMVKDGNCCRFKII